MAKIELDGSPRRIGIRSADIFRVLEVQIITLLLMSRSYKVWKELLKIGRWIR